MGGSLYECVNMILINTLISLSPEYNGQMNLRKSNLLQSGGYYHKIFKMVMDMKDAIKTKGCGHVVYISKLRVATQISSS